MYVEDRKFKQAIGGTAIHGFFLKTPKHDPVALKRLGEELQMRILLPHEIHSNKVLVIETPWSVAEDPPEVDALITELRGVALAVFVADCVPVILVDSLNSIIAIAHSGWRGSVAGIVPAVIANMEKLGSQPDTLKCLIGPCIRQESYEVGQDVYDAALGIDSEQKSSVFKPTSEGKYLFDIPGYIKHQLSICGVLNVYDCNINTFADKRCSSYRRSRADLTTNNLIFVALDKDDDDWEKLKFDVKPIGKKRLVKNSGNKKNHLEQRKQINTILQTAGRKVDCEIDLHSYSIDEAYDALEQFIIQQSQADIRFILVITGKGSSRKNVNSPTLNVEVPNWLESSKLSKYISHFTIASSRDGGPGAFYVFLKKHILIKD